MYIHEQEGWPAFRWDAGHLAALLAEVRHRQGLLLGRMSALGFPSRTEAALRTLTQDVVKTSEIEGERLDTEQVRSSIAQRMGVHIGGLPRVDRNVDGIVEVMFDATTGHDRPMTAERLFEWHAGLFPTGRSGIQRITVGSWRNEASGPMQVVSGPYGRETVHFEAPGHARLETEMTRFLEWFNGPVRTDPVIRSALAHFWFVTIHPFDDGNGRIARAIADMALAQSEHSSQRFYSMSSQIQQERKAYYDVLESSQKGSLDITAWIEWFLGCLQRAVEASEATLQDVLTKARFWEKHAGANISSRQQLLLNRLLDGFEGKLTSSKWALIAKCSQDTALREINDLVQRGILVRQEAGGRSTSYGLVVPKP
ncbi:MAG: Fic family protein [Limisphaerales bacterium]|jgi:Fic family protein